MDQATLDEVKKQVLLYKEWRSVFQNGRFYRGENVDDGNVVTWNVVSSDGSSSAGMMFRRLAVPNDQRGVLKMHGLEGEKKYRFYSLPFKMDVRLFGDLINMISPVHVKNGSMVHDIISRFVKLDGEHEDTVIFGDALDAAGVELSPAYSSTGFNERTRVFPDFASRLYFAQRL